MSDPDVKPRAPVEFPARDEPFDFASFPCPRCNKVFAAQTYAPCPDCVAELKASQRTEGGNTAAAAYEPKMNVTPNAVALKDD